MDKTFKFAIGQTVKISVSDEVGRVIARAECETCSDDYLLFYKDGTGCAVQKWWSVDKIEAAN